MIDLKTRVREVPDFPKAGVGFKDISALLLDQDALAQAVEELGVWTRERGADLVLGAEARGFWLGGAIAVAAGCGSSPPVGRKLPPETVSARYVLEYGQNTLEVAADANAQGARVVIHDDVLATGGTVQAIAGLVEELGGTVVGMNFVIELSFLGGAGEARAVRPARAHHVLTLRRRDECWNEGSSEAHARPTLNSMDERGQQLLEAHIRSLDPAELTARERLDEAIGCSLGVEARLRRCAKNLYE